MTNPPKSNTTGGNTVAVTATQAFQTIGAVPTPQLEIGGRNAITVIVGNQWRRVLGLEDPVKTYAVEIEATTMSRGC